MTAANPPITIAAIVSTKPEAGVIATRPTTAPVATPRTLGRRCNQLKIIQTVAAAAAAVLVTTKALTARPLAARAEPPLKPNQPNQSSTAPMTTSGILPGSILSLP